MQYIVTANDFGVGIGKQRESVADFLRLPPVDLRRINADADYAYPARIKIRKPSLKTPQLGVAKRSPKSAIENQRDCFRSRRSREQISETHGFSILIQ